jgi:hypothetical protein
MSELTVWLGASLTLAKPRATFRRCWGWAAALSRRWRGKQVNRVVQTSELGDGVGIQVGWVGDEKAARGQEETGIGAKNVPEQRG